MNKTELIDAVAAATDKPKTEVKAILEAVIDTIVKTVAEKQEVTLIGFGTFKSAHREAHEGRNPANGEKITIAASTTPKFVAGKAFKEAVNK